MKHMYRAMAALALLLYGIHPERRLIAQQPSQAPTPSWLQKRWDSAHNQWQRTPADISRQTDTVNPEVRAKRNAYWMQPMLQVALKSGPPLSGSVIELPEVEELGDSQSIWVVANFEGLRVFALDPDSTLLYTEENMGVVDVIKSPDDLHISLGSLLDVQIIGGTVKTAQGTVHACWIEPRQFAAQPGHTYLLHLLRNPLYGTTTTHQRWEISSGVLVPDDEGEVRRAQEGKSMLAGKSIDQASKYIQETLQTQSGKQKGSR